MKTLFKILYYSNKNLPRNQFFKFIKGDKCIVFAFRMFDISFWWGDSYADMDYSGNN